MTAYLNSEWANVALCVKATIKLFFLTGIGPGIGLYLAYECWKKIPAKVKILLASSADGSDRPALWREAGIGDCILEPAARSGNHLEESGSSADSFFIMPLSPMVVRAKSRKVA